MPASKPIPREADGTVDIKQARKRMRGHRTDAEIEEKAKREVRAKEPKRIQVPKYLPQGMADEYRQTAKKLVALHQLCGSAELGRYRGAAALVRERYL